MLQMLRTVGNIDSIISKMTLRQKIGQCFMVCVDGFEISNDIKAKLQKNIPGNFIIFQCNVKNEYQLRKYIYDLKEITMKNHDIPPFISIDHEGGCVHRLRDLVTHVTSPMGIVATRSVGDVIQNCEIISSILAKDIYSLGFNLNYVPDCDVNSNPTNPVIGTRSFGSDPTLISKFVKTFIQKHQNIGVLTSAKHFPGHGDTDTDSHFQLPKIPRTLEQMEKEDLIPFQAAIDAGVDTVMVSHIISNIDPDSPASLSAKTISYLRNKMNYDKIVITDCLTMKALGDLTMYERCKRALIAGVDICLVGHDLDDALDSMEKIYEDVSNGNIPECIINKAVKHILEAKLKIKDEKIQNDREENQRLSNMIAESSVSIVGDETLLPVHDTQMINCAPNIQVGPFNKVDGPLFNDILKIPTIDLPHDPTDLMITNALQKIVSDTIIFASCNIGKFPQQLKLYNSIKKAGKKVIVVSMWYPSDYLLTKDADLNIVTYTQGRVAHDALVKVFKGDKIGNHKVLL